MFEQLNAAGYDLSEVTLDQWIFSVRGGKIFVGTFTQVARLMILEHGFTIGAIEQATNEMLANDHNTAHFGMYKSMIFTFNREDNQQKAG